MTRWLDIMTSILGLYEAPGEADNPNIINMAKACGGKIAATYKHDSTAWCALTTNYCLHTAGLRGDDSLWALDFRKYGVKLPGPAVGAIATKTRDGGGHVFLVVGRTAAGRIVGRGGNQADMVCDETYDPAVLQYNWPPGMQLPATGMAILPIVTPKAHVHREVIIPAPGKVPAAPSPKPRPVPPRVELLIPAAPAAPEPDDTKPHAAPEGSPKTGITEGAQAAGGLTLAGIVAQAWEAISQAPDTILQALVGLVEKPAFLIALGVLGAIGFVWWQRRNMKKAAT
jgi:uncharacterized protein (TIGR02594 family)